MEIEFAGSPGFLTPLRAKQREEEEEKRQHFHYSQGQETSKRAEGAPCVVQEGQRRKCIPAQEPAELKGARPSPQNRWPRRLWNEVVIPGDPASDKAEMALPVI